MDKVNKINLLKEIKEKVDIIENILLNDNSYIVKGWLSFRANFKEIIIRDNFKIELKIPVNFPNELPIVKEIGGRINRNKNNHINVDKGNSLCLGTPIEIALKLRDNISISNFIDKLVIRFLYAFSYKEKYGYYPWGERKHGNEGILQSYKDLFKLKSNKQTIKFLSKICDCRFNGRKACPCSKKLNHKKILFKNCHKPYVDKIKKIYPIEKIKQEFYDIVNFT